MFQRLVLGALILHAVESVIALALLIYAKIPVSTLVFWFIYILIFGMASFRPAVKLAIKRSKLTFGPSFT